MSEVRVPVGSAPEWLPVGAASRHLGVDRDTLRRWAEAGRVEVFTTPGGHRRFSRASLDRLAARRGPARRPYATDLTPSSARIAAAYRRSYTHGGPGELMTAVAPGEAERESFRLAGRTLVEALVRYVDAATDDERAAAEADAGEATVSFAERLSGASIGVAEAIAAFVSARRPFLGRDHPDQPPPQPLGHGGQRAVRALRGASRPPGHPLRRHHDHGDRRRMSRRQRRAAPRVEPPELRLRDPRLRPVAATTTPIPAHLGAGHALVRAGGRGGVPGRLHRLERAALQDLVPDRCHLGRRLARPGHGPAARTDAVRLQLRAGARPGRACSPS